MRSWILTGFLAFAACGPTASNTKTLEKVPVKPITAPSPVFHADNNPDTLSDWGILASNGQFLALANDSFVYELNSALFSDYAHKLRTIHLPDGQRVQWHDDNDRIEFPTGTIITKTFYYEKGGREADVLKTDTAPQLNDHKLALANIRLIETRLLVRRTAGWEALPYVWNDAQTEARLMRTGDVKRLSLVSGSNRQDFAYIVPNTNQCAGCHATNNTTRVIEPIGPKFRHLQSLSHFKLTEPINAYRNVNWQDETAPLGARARAYLDINCSHCHNQVGPADTSGLHLEPTTALGPHLGVCKTPIAAGTGTGNRKHGIVPGDSEASIFTYRMESTNPAEMMPELGRSLAHDEGVELIKAWINNLGGHCN